MRNKSIIYQLKITLLNTKPPIWRRIYVQSDEKLPDLHKIIQITMGQANSHLHVFYINGKTYTLPDDYKELEYIDYRKIRLNTFILNEGEKFKYIYDMGDDWVHNIKLEAILPYDSKIKYPICVAGKRRCPPEDCGGPYGYEDILEIIKNTKSKEYKEIMDWLPDKFNPDEFDIDKVNKLLQEDAFGCISIED